MNVRVLQWSVFVISLSLVASNAFSQTIIFPDANGNFHVPERPVLRGTEANERELPEEEYQTRANSLTSIGDFANFFNVDLAKANPPKRNFTIAKIATRLGGTFIQEPGPIPQELEQAVCTPELTTVPLELPEGPGLSFFPTCVRVNRCGGCCFLSHHSCQPTATKTLLVKAVKIQEEVTRSRRRRMRDAEPDFVTAEVEEHLECDCKCRLQESDCNLAIQVYKDHLCDCVCKDSAKELVCMGSRDHFWNHDTCECLCRQTISCSSSQEFDHATCSCK